MRMFAAALGAKLRRAGSIAAWCLGLLLATSATAPAVNTVLLACGETSCMTATGTAGNLATNASCSTVCRSGWARLALDVGAIGTGDPPTSYWLSPTFTASSTLWVHAQIWAGVSNSSGAGTQLLRVYSPDGVARILVRVASTNDSLKLSTRNAAGTITDIGSAAAAAFSNASLFALDLAINYTCSGSGSVTLYINSTAVISFTGNPCTDAATTLGQIALGSLDTVNTVSCATNQNDTCWSEIIVQNFSTLGEGLLSLTGTGLGNTSNWDACTLANINKTGKNSDGTFNFSTATGEKCQLTQGASIPSGTWGVLAVTQDFRALVGATGPQTLYPLLRTAGADYTGSGISPTTSFTNFNYVWATNPATTNPWQTSDITGGLQWGSGD